MAKRWLFSF